MDHDTITEVGIDDKARLYVMPLTKTFPYIYPEAMEVSMLNQSFKRDA